VNLSVLTNSYVSTNISAKLWQFPPEMNTKGNFYTTEIITDDFFYFIFA